MQVWKYPPNRQPWVVTTQGWQILGLGLDNPGLTITYTDDTTQGTLQQMKIDGWNDQNTDIIIQSYR